MALTYNFTDAQSVQVALSLTLSDIDDLKRILQAGIDQNLDLGVSHYRVRSMVRALTDAQRMAADTLAYEAQALKDATKPADE